jgi:hypothetical protein
MTDFDPVVWRERVFSRYRASSAKGKKTSKARLTNDLVAITSLEILTDWCSARDISIKHAKFSGAQYSPDDKMITLSSALAPERCVHMLLHEIGHILIGASDKHERYNMGWAQALDPIAKRTIHHRLDILEEEFEAWNRGYKLSTKLKLSIDKKSFDRTRISCLRSYVLWAAKDERFSGPITSNEEMKSLEIIEEQKSKTSSDAKG